MICNILIFLAWMILGVVSILFLIGVLFAILALIDYFSIMRKIKANKEVGDEQNLKDCSEINLKETNTKIIELKWYDKLFEIGTILIWVVLYGLWVVGMGLFAIVFAPIETIHHWWKNKE